MMEERENLRRHLLQAVKTLRPHGRLLEEIVQYLLPLLVLKAVSDTKGQIDATKPLKAEFTLPWSQGLAFSLQLPQLVKDFFVQLRTENPTWSQAIPFISLDSRDAERLAELVIPLSGFTFDPNYLPPSAGIEILMDVLTEDRSQEFQDPRDLAQLAAALLDAEPGMSLLDPACGKGSLLVEAAKQIAAKFPHDAELDIYGQDKQENLIKFCQMSMLMHGFQPEALSQGDTLTEPLKNKAQSLLLVDRVVCTPPVGHLDTEQLKTLSGLPSRLKMALEPKFLRQILSSLNERGRAVVVLLHGLLFRSGEEEKLRRSIIQTDTLETVINLPRGIFHMTPIAAAIVVLNRAKQVDRQNKVLFLDASSLGTKDRRGKSTLSGEDIASIVEATKNFGSQKMLAQEVTVEKIMDNLYDLNPNLYLFSSLPVPDINVSELRDNAREKELLFNQSTEAFHRTLEPFGISETDDSHR